MAITTSSSNILKTDFRALILQTQTAWLQIDVIVADVMAYTDSLNRVEGPMSTLTNTGLANAYRSLRLNFTTTQIFEPLFLHQQHSHLVAWVVYNDRLNNIFDNMVSSYNVCNQISIGNTLGSLCIVKKSPTMLRQTKLNQKSIVCRLIIQEGHEHDEISFFCALLTGELYY
jgi:hypothetical protein